MKRDDWIEIRLGDSELLGWVEPRGENFVAIDLLGRERTAPTDWITAEETLERLGIGYLADAYELLQAGTWRRVRITEVTPEKITVRSDDWGGAINSGLEYFTVDFPVPATLRVKLAKSR